MVSAPTGAASPFAHHLLPLKSGFLSEPLRVDQGRATWCFLNLKPWLKSCNQSTTVSTASPEFLPASAGDAASPHLVQHKPLEPALGKPQGHVMPSSDAHFSISLDFPLKKERYMCTTEHLYHMVRKGRQVQAQQAQWETSSHAPGGLCSLHQEGLQSSVNNSGKFM